MNDRGFAFVWFVFKGDKKLELKLNDFFFAYWGSEIGFYKFGDAPIKLQTL